MDTYVDLKHFGITFRAKNSHIKPEDAIGHPNHGLTMTYRSDLRAKLPIVLEATLAMIES